jgi:cell division protein FtsB
MLNNLKQKTKDGTIVKLIFKLSVLALVLSIFSQMYVSSKLAVKSGELAYLSARQDELRKEIALMELEDTALSSLAYLEEQARLLGFVEMQENVLAIKPTPSVSAVISSSN